jgi:MPBQ/MSBQ methyltransferase
LRYAPFVEGNQVSELNQAPADSDFDASVNFQRYYADAGPDYSAWSPNFNMHFGYFRRGMNPFRLEPMLERMNREILARLRLQPQQHTRVLDIIATSRPLLFCQRCSSR